MTDCEKQKDEPIPWPYPETRGEMGGGIACVGERYKAGKWVYCYDRRRCKAHEKNRKQTA